MRIPLDHNEGGPAPAKDWPMYGNNPTWNAITTGNNPPMRWGIVPGC
jgi:hypothetical protein